jgi:HD-GYP domain-containing protein (c-di-GMP phosphodiesterase class II)
MIHALASTVEMRVPYTAGHQQRVARLASAIAGGMGLPEEKINGIHTAASAHDIGNLSVPAEIFRKLGRLSEIEMGLIKTHSRQAMKYWQV